MVEEGKGRQTLHERLCSTFSFHSLQTTNWFLTSCFSVYKINSLMRVLFADCGLTSLWSVEGISNICLSRIVVSIEFPCVHFSLILISSMSLGWQAFDHFTILLSCWCRFSSRHVSDFFPDQLPENWKRKTIKLRSALEVIAIVSTIQRARSVFLIHCHLLQGSSQSKRIQAHLIALVCFAPGRFSIDTTSSFKFL